MRTIRTSLAVLFVSVASVALPAVAHAAPKFQTVIQYGWNWGS